MKKYILISAVIVILFCFSGILGIHKAADDAGTGELLSGSSDVSQAADETASLEKKKVALTFDDEDVIGPNIIMFAVSCFL